MKILQWSLLSVLFIYCALALFLFIKQRDFIYFPSPVIQHPYEEVSFTNKDDNYTVRTTVLNKGKPTAIIYFGGNGEAVDLNASDFSRTFPNQSVYLVKYRGYSGSDGTATEEALFSDALTVYDNLKSNYQSVAVIGRSLGSGVACYVASQRPVKKLALITPFDSAQSIAQSAYPIFPMSLLLKDKYDSVSRANKIQAKVLFLIAQQDQTITRKHSERLMDAFPATQIQVIVFNNVGHNTISSNPEYYQALNTFATFFPQKMPQRTP